MTDSCEWPGTQHAPGRAPRPVPGAGKRGGAYSRVITLSAGNRDLGSAALKSSAAR